jgi:pyridoxine 5-phosphate synthase
MAPTSEMLRLARKIKPDLVTIVPERPGEVTTEGGIDASRLAKKLAPHIRALKRAGLGVSLFIDPEEKQIKAALKLDVAVIELNTNAYSAAKTSEEAAAAYDVLVDAAEQADEAGLVVAAGHGLTVRNVGPVAAIPEIGELNIGHSIVARAALIGLERSVREMREAIAAAELF